MTSHSYDHFAFFKSGTFNTLPISNSCGIDTPSRCVARLCCFTKGSKSGVTIVAERIPVRSMFTTVCFLLVLPFMLITRQLGGPHVKLTQEIGAKLDVPSSLYVLIKTTVV